MAKALRQGSTNLEDIITAYRLFDREDKGYFTRSELEAVLKRFTGGSVTEADLNQIMSMGGSGPKPDAADGLPTRGAGASSPSEEPVISKQVFVSLFK